MPSAIQTPPEAPEQLTADFVNELILVPFPTATYRAMSDAAAKKGITTAAFLAQAISAFMKSAG